VGDGVGDLAGDGVDAATCVGVGVCDGDGAVSCDVPALQAAVADLPDVEVRLYFDWLLIT
jgi:hypothetical protein